MPIIKTIGIFADQRPYEPATPLGTNLGLDVGATITLVKIPDDFRAALSKVGAPTPPIPVAPIPMLQVHKGISSSFDLGVGLLRYKSYSIMGADAKLVVWMPEEGPTWAIRVTHSRAKIQFLQTTTTSLQVLASRKLDFADPYAGVGAQYIWGQAVLNAADLGVPISQVLKAEASALAALAFMGVSLRVPIVGFKLTLEGSYSTSGTHTMGTKVGFEF